MPVHTELCYEPGIDTECLLHNDVPTQCRYYTPAQFSTNFSGTDLANNLSLKANLNKIKDTLRDLEYKFHSIAISDTWFKENNWDGNEVTHFDDAFLGYKLYCNSRNKTKQAVVLPYLYANLYLECANLLIYAYGTYHIRLMNVSKVFLLNYRSVDIQKSMSAVYIEHRILGLANFMKSYHVYQEILPIMQCTYVVILIQIYYTVKNKLSRNISLIKCSVLDCIP